MRKGLPPLTPRADMVPKLDSPESSRRKPDSELASNTLIPKDAPGLVPARSQPRRPQLPAAPLTPPPSPPRPRTPRPDRRPTLTDVPLQISTPLHDGVGKVALQRQSSVESASSSQRYRSNQTPESSDDDDEENNHRPLRRRSSAAAGSKASALVGTPDSTDDEEEKAVAMWKAVLDSFDDPTLAVRRQRPMMTSSSPPPRSAEPEIFPGVPPRLAWSLMFTGVTLCLVLLLVDLVMGILRGPCDCSADEPRGFP